MQQYPALPHSDVIVIGGGVIGMSCAYELARRGTRVAVIDRGEMGYGCSYGNAGWITPCFALPLPMPGMFWKSIGWLMDPGSPLYIKPELNPLLFQWLFRFMRSMNQRQMKASVAALTEISKYSLDAYAKLAEEFPSIGFDRKGLLMVAQTDAGVRSALEELELVGAHGVPGKSMTPEEIRALEPALTGKLRGGVYFPTEAHAEPLQVVKAMMEGAVKAGAVMMPRTEVFDFDVEGASIKRIRTTHGWLSAKQFVLATGSWSTPIARSLKLNIPVMGGKGYALIVKPFTPTPKIPMMLIEKKIAVTPRKDTIRLAGTLELVDRDEGITKRRVDAIQNGAREFMNVPEQPEVYEIWRGLRPCTPDGVPVIGRPKKYSNLTVSTGHQMLGLQSAPGSGRLTAELVLGISPTFDPFPFRADRF